jgi:hypothetical protein
MPGPQTLAVKLAAAHPQSPLPVFLPPGESFLPVRNWWRQREAAGLSQNCTPVSMKYISVKLESVDVQAWIAPSA